MLIQLFFLIACAVIAFWMSAICGGGASLILIPALNFVLPNSVIPFSLTVGTFTSSASRIAVFVRHVRWDIFTWFVPFSIPAVLLGAWLMKYINPLYLQLVVSVFLMANVPELFRTRTQQEAEEKPYPKFILAVVGFFAGLISGITGAIGLLFNRFYLRYGLSKEEIVATRAANEIFLHFIKLIIYLLLGVFSRTALWFGLAIAVASVASSLTVKFLLPLLSEYVFRKVGYAAMVASGLILFVSTSKSAMEENNISIATAVTADKNETVVRWRQSNFILEFAFDEGLEIERPITEDELPVVLKKKYDELLPQYDKIFLEKVFKLNEKPGYEFYCYKAGKLSKYDLND